jgi:3-(3-hydroxy-phenyl)propionate hydroxylase
MLPSRVDVLVVGYGPVGAALCALLGRYGVRTLVIDKATEVHLAPRAIALDNEALRILQWAGLADDAFERIVIPRVSMHCPFVGPFATISMAGLIDDHPKLVTFYQPDLERALRARVASHPSVTVALGVELTGFVDEGGEVRATLQSADGSSHALTARYVVGADGAWSKVRQIIGQDFTGQSYTEDWLIVDATGVPGTFDHVEFHCDPRRPTPHMVAPGGRRRWEFMVLPGEDRAVVERDVQRLLHPWTRGETVTIERQAVYRFHARSCARYSRGRAFLVGDAAHITPPFAGQGLVAGLRDVANLAWKLAWVVRGHASDSILDSYDRERRPHAAKMIALATRMGRVIVPRTRLGAVVVHGVMRLVGSIPGLRRLIREGGLKPKPRFANGLFLAGGGQLRRGGILPQTRVSNTEGSSSRTDDVLGPELTLVGFGVDPASQLAEPTLRRWLEHGGTCRTLPATGMLRKDQPWCAVVRPDYTVMNDGPIVRVERVVKDALDLLDGRRALA